MPDIEIECIADVRCQLGEGPLWDTIEQAIYWVDASKARIYRLEYPDGPLEHWDLPGKTVGSLALRKSAGAILAMDQGLYTFDFETAGAETITQALGGDERARFNDGKTDRQGRFFAGSMDIEAETPIGRLYRLDSDLTCTQIDRGFKCFNGPCFSPDARAFYCTGRTFETIEAYDYDASSGECTNRRAFYAEGIACDGATVDSQGGLWSAQLRGEVRRIESDGTFDRAIEIPGHVVTSVMFGGRDLDVLFVTTAKEDLGFGEPTAAYAGGLLAVRGLGANGIAEARFAG